MSDSVEGKELVDALLGLGLAATYESIEATLINIFSVRSLNELSLGLYEFIEIFKTTKKTDRYLETLNYYSGLGKVDKTWEDRTAHELVDATVTDI
jgi:hypothetical protein